MIFKIFIGYDERDEFQQRREKMTKIISFIATLWRLMFRVKSDFEFNRQPRTHDERSRELAQGEEHMNAVKSGEYLETIVLARLRRTTPDNMSEAVIKARERHGKPFSYESGSTWKPHATRVLTQWLQSKGEKK